jgi:lysyl-tRNA synthetase class 1
MQTEIKISFDDMEKFLSQVVTDAIDESFVRIAREFELRRKPLEEAVQMTLKDAPLMARIPQAVMAEDRVVAKIGSVEDDPFGRLINEAKVRFSFLGVWLDQTFERLLERHDLQPQHFVGWANRHGVFADMALLLEGVRAWFNGDFAKATHILIPQIEVAMRAIAGQLGVPVTKALPKIPDTSVAIGMGDILYTAKVTDELGPDLTLHLQALFADPRGLNLRNEMAHGLLGAVAFDGHVVRLLVHTLLMLGVWKELAAKGQKANASHEWERPEIRDDGPGIARSR